MMIHEDISMTVLAEKPVGRMDALAIAAIPREMYVSTEFAQQLHILSTYQRWF